MNICVANKRVDITLQQRRGAFSRYKIRAYRHRAQTIINSNKLQLNTAIIDKILKLCFQRIHTP